MMKRFVSAMLGSLAAIWMTFLLLFALFIFFLTTIFSDSFMSQFIRANFKPHTALYINLNNTITEREQSSNILLKAIGIESDKQNLDQIKKALAAATSDPKIEGVYIECNDCKGGGATLSEIREAIKQFKASGKWVVAYGDNYSQPDYFVASTADEIYINPYGMMDLHGLTANTFFYKGLLDKVGIDAQVFRVGTYKSAVEPFIADAPSAASVRQQEVFLHEMWSYMSNEIAIDRGIDITELNNMADSLIITMLPEDYVTRRLADKLAYRHEFESALKSRLGLSSSDDLRLITPADYCLIADIPHSAKNKNRIAVLYAVGEIFDKGDKGISASNIVPLIQEITDNTEIDGLILRVNSGGGSAFASEQIWEALEQFKKTGRPFYVSMGDYAASGGYYISSGANQIFADAMTLTGSIGIFGIIPCVKDLLNNHLGITVSAISTNDNGTLPTLTTPMTQFQKTRIQAYVDRGYETFVERCATGRHMSTDSIKAIAEGRVWDAQSALKIGLIDHIGSLDDATASMASELNFGNNYAIVEYPIQGKKSFFKRLFHWKTSVKDNILTNELGENAWIFDNIKRIQQLAPIQCRMEDIKVM